MQCRRCGKELRGSMRCNFCGYENIEGNVREMTRTEKNFYRGVTIDAETGEESSNRDNFNFKTRRTYVNYGGSNIFSRIFGSRLAQIAALLIGLAISALIFFIALPIIFVILAIGLALLAWVRR